MADVKGYPKIPESTWWAMRNQFQKSLPTTMTTSYLVSVLKLSEASAKNLLPSLRQIGFLDDEDKINTTRVNDWRTDQNYTQVCNTIREEIYPKELREAFPDSIDREGIKAWFAHTGMLGDSAARQSASMYALLTEATVKSSDEITQKQKVTVTKKVPNTKQKTLKENTEETAIDTPAVATTPSIGQQQTEAAAGMTPTLHIDLQIHISPDASSEQIDNIFASMAKHLYK